ncbi:MAG: hypothetical protein FVQ80_14055 [Planctomycetes bacterium]|nr:hypothetical protein [Planctomycetota bacterium]
MSQIKQPSPARITAGRITAKRAAELAGLRLPQVVDLCHRELIFGVWENGLWRVSPAVVSELKILADRLRVQRHVFELRIIT